MTSLKHGETFNKKYTNKTTENIQLKELYLLDNKLQKLLGKFSQSEKLYHEEIKDFRNKTRHDSNFYVGDISIENTKNSYKGCYYDNNFNSLNKPEKEGKIFTEEMCRLRAIDQGMELYGLQDTDKNNTGYCVISNNLGKATQYGKVGDDKLPRGTWRKHAYMNGNSDDTYIKNNIFYTVLKTNMTTDDIKKHQLSNTECLNRFIEIKKAIKNNTEMGIVLKETYDLSSDQSILNYLMNKEKLCPNPTLKPVSIKYSPGSYYYVENNILKEDPKKRSYCKSIDGKMYGVGDANALYFQEKINKEALGKTFYGSMNDDNMYNFKEYPNNLLVPGTDFFKINNYNSPNHDISGGQYTNVNPEQCKKLCIETNNCAGFVYKTARDWEYKTKKTKSFPFFKIVKGEPKPQCLLKNKIYPNTGRTQNPQRILGIKVKNVYDMDPDNYLRIFGSSPSNIYTRMPNISSDPSCNKSIKGVNTSFISKHGTINSDSMTESTPCLLKEYTYDVSQRNTNISNELITTAENIINKMSNLLDSRSKILNLEKETKNKFVNDIKYYTAILNKIKYIKNNNNTISAFHDDSIIKMNQQYIYYIISILGFIILTFLIVKNIKK